MTAHRLNIKFKFVGGSEFTAVVQIPDGQQEYAESYEVSYDNEPPFAVVPLHNHGAGYHTMCGMYGDDEVITRVDTF